MPLSLLNQLVTDGTHYGRQIGQGKRRAIKRKGERPLPLGITFFGPHVLFERLPGSMLCLGPAGQPHDSGWRAPTGIAKGF